MIDTIFYFPERYSEYEGNLGRISDRTITFVKDTKQIFKGGLEYGSTTVKPATTSTLGGIKLYRDSDVLPEKSYPVQLDSNNKAFVSVPWVAAINSDGSISGYDDREVRRIVAALRADLDDLANRVDEDAMATLTRTIREYQAIMEQFGANYEGGIPWRWEDELKGYIQYVIRTDADGNRATWSSLIQRADEIEARVQNVERINTININGQEATLQALISDLHLYIDDKTGTAIANLKTEWALTDEDLNKIKWLVSGFNSETNSTRSFAEMYSQAKSSQDDAIAAIRTQVQYINNNYVAQTEIGAKIKQNLAGLYVEAGDSNALASLVAAAGENNTASIIVNAINNSSDVTITADKIDLNGVVNAVSDIIAGEDLGVGGDIYLEEGQHLAWHGTTSGGGGHHSLGYGETAYITYDQNNGGWTFSPAIGGSSQSSQSSTQSGTIHALGADFIFVNGIITAVTPVQNLSLSLS